MPDEGRAAWFCRKAGDLKQGMYVLAVSILKNEADVEDAMQNALISILTSSVSLINSDHGFLRF